MDGAQALAGRPSAVRRGWSRPTDSNYPTEAGSGFGTPDKEILLIPSGFARVEWRGVLRVSSADFLFVPSAARLRKFSEAPRNEATSSLLMTDSGEGLWVTPF